MPRRLSYDDRSGDGVIALQRHGQGELEGPLQPAFGRSLVVARPYRAIVGKDKSADAVEIVALRRLQRPQMTARTKRVSSTDGLPIVTSADGSVTYCLFEVATGVVVQRSVRPRSWTRIDHFIRFADLESLERCAEFEARHLGEFRLAGRLVHAFGASLSKVRDRVQDAAAPAVQQDYASAVMSIVARIQTAANQAEVLDLMHQASQAIGADASVYASVIPNPGQVSPTQRFLLDCDAARCYDDKQACSGAGVNDPWLAYAQAHSEPMLIDEAPGAGRRRFGGLRSSEQFRYALLIPTPSAGGSMRLGVMALGSATQGLFEPEQTGMAKLLGRMLAWEVNGWWFVESGRALRREAGLDELDLRLLAMQRGGLSDLQAAPALELTAAVTAKRWGSVLRKLSATDRAAALQRAMDYGLI